MARKTDPERAQEACEDEQAALDRGEGDFGEEIAPSKVAREELERQLEEAKTQSKERLDQLLRCQADMENALKRAARERQEMSKYASERIITRLLGILDSLEEAAKHDAGSKVLLNQFMDVMRGEGLSPIDAIGRKFDPNFHEAMMCVSSDELDDDYVAQEFQRGYTLHSKVIRTSKVAVAKRQ
ncbi:MAG: nucleotide exchange factor GrpE [Methanotrichaceae archaeon]|nr:nucleotide exchange factor GrpE [Methanotrichaceae archaeon]